MTNKEKQLLLKDLCARLPYGVKVKYLYWDEDKGCEYPVPMILDDINSDGYIRFHGDIAEGEGRGMLTQYFPYLRPMSSMTEEEGKEWEQLLNYNLSDENEMMVTVFVEDTPDYIDWFNAHHFDYRNLIEKSLAIVAPDDMYK